MSDRKSSVLLVGNFLSAARNSRSVCEDLAEQLGAAGWHVTTTSRYPGRIARLIDMVVTAWAKRHHYSVAQVDVYSGLAFSWAEIVCWVLRRASKTYILTMHGGNLPVFARRWPSRVRHLIQSAAAVTTPSRYLLDELKPYRDHLSLLPNPLDLSSYSFKVRKQVQPHLIWLRAFNAIYNPSLAPKVLALLADDFPDIQLIMIGPDTRDGSLQAMQRVAIDMGVISRITLPGGVAKGEVPSWMAKGDIFLNTTNVDNTPVSVTEAMACGLCIVSTNVGGIPHLLGNEQDALLVPPNDPEAMAAAVRRFLAEPGLSARLSRNARTKAVQFDWSVLLPQWEHLLLSVIDQRAE